MKKQLVSLAFLLGLTTGAFAQTEHYTIDSTHTYPSFEVNHMGFSLQRGQFNKTTGNIALDPEKQIGSMDVSIETNSLASGFAKRDEHLKGEGFFNVAKYPTMTFKSNHLIFEGKTLKAVEGQLTLLGVTKPVRLEVNYFHVGVNPMTQKVTYGANAITTIKRSAFGMNTFLPAIGDDVKLNIQIEAFKN